MWTSDAISIVAEQRNNFAPGTKMIIGIGGWGDTAGFSEGAKTDDSRKLFAKNIVAMLEQTGADGELGLTHVKKKSTITELSRCGH